MITHETITKGQAKWLAMITEFYPDIVKSGVITHKQVQEANQFFYAKRTKDKKYRVGHPIWLLVNNAITRGVYQLPVPGAVIEVKKIDVDTSHELYADYASELASFGVK